MKKILLGLGALAAAAAPIAAVVSCGNVATERKTDDHKNNTGAEVTKNTAPANVVDTTDWTKLTPATAVAAQTPLPVVAPELKGTDQVVMTPATTIAVPTRKSEVFPDVHVAIPTTQDVNEIPEKLKLNKKDGKPSFLGKTDELKSETKHIADERKELAQKIFDNSFNGFIDQLVQSTPDAYVEDMDGVSHLDDSVEQLVNIFKGSVKVIGTETNEELSQLINTNGVQFAQALNDVLQSEKFELAQKLAKAVAERKDFSQKLFDNSFNGYIDVLLSKTPDAYTQDAPLSERHLVASIQQLVDNAKGSVKVTGTETQEEFNALINKNIKEFKEAFDALLQAEEFKLMNKLKASSKTEATDWTEQTSPIEVSPAIEITKYADVIPTITVNPLPQKVYGGVSVDHDEVPGEDMKVVKTPYQVPEPTPTETIAIGTPKLEPITGYNVAPGEATVNEERKAFAQQLFDASFNGYIDNLIKNTPDAYMNPERQEELDPQIQQLVDNAKGSVKVIGTETNEEMNALINKNTKDFKEAFDATLVGIKNELMNKLKIRH